MARIVVGAVTTLQLDTQIDPQTLDLYGLRELISTPAYVSGTSYGAYTAANPKLTFDANFQLGYKVTPSAWGTNYAALDFGTTAGIASTGSITYLSDNTYNDNTNDRAKATGLGVRVKLTAGTWKIQIAPSVSAAAVQTFVDAVQVDASGNLIVGNNNSANPGWVLNNVGGGTVGNSAGSAGFVFLNILRSGTVIGSITQTSTTGVAYNQTSDRRLKENIRDFALDAWRVLRGAMPKTYEWRSDGETGHGYIAQALHRFFPSAVTVGHSRSKKPWQVDASKVVPVLHAALVDADDRLRAMEKRIAKLEAALAKAKR